MAKMNFLRVVVIFLGLLACKPRADVAPANLIEISPPLRPQVALYLNEYKLGPHQGATLRPNLLNWSPKAKGKFSASTHQEGKPPYSATLEYLGRKSGADLYSVTVTHPAGAGFKTLTKEIEFSGVEVETFRDDQYQIGLRADSESAR